MGGFETRSIAKLSSGGITRGIDQVALENPLLIILQSEEHGRHELGITMRTSGHDKFLTVGFMYSEGIISSMDDIDSLVIGEDMIEVVVNGGSSFDPSVHCRSGTVTSSCGICGRSDISKGIDDNFPELDEHLQIGLEAVNKCLNSVQPMQEVFTITGGAHACASFNSDGSIERIFEDVGRHNAFDKLVGSYLLDGGVPQTGLAAFVSGRASFELVQKSIRAGFPIMIAVGAPSTLAVDLAKEHGLTLGCFAKNESITLFSGVRRIIE